MSQGQTAEKEPETAAERYMVYQYTISDISHAVSQDVRVFLESKDWYKEVKAAKRVTQNTYLLPSKSGLRVRANISFKDRDLVYKCKDELRKAGFPMEVIDVNEDDYTSFMQYPDLLWPAVSGTMIVYILITLWHYELSLAYAAKLAMCLLTLRTYMGFAIMISFSGGLPYDVFYPFLLSGYCFSLFWIPALLQLIGMWPITYAVILAGWYMHYRDKKKQLFEKVFGVLMTYLILLHTH